MPRKRRRVKVKKASNAEKATPRRQRLRRQASLKEVKHSRRQVRRQVTTKRHLLQGKAYQARMSRPGCHGS